MFFKVIEVNKVEYPVESIEVYQYEYTLQKRGMSTIEVSVSKPHLFPESMVYWNTIICGNRMGYKNHFIPPKITAICNILKHTPIYSKSHYTCIVVYHHYWSKSMSKNGSPLKRANSAPPDGRFGYQQRLDNYSGSWDNSSFTATGIDNRSGKPNNWCLLPHGSGYLPSLQPFPGATQCLHCFRFSQTQNSFEPTNSTYVDFLWYRPQWPGYTLWHCGLGGSQMLHTKNLPGYGPWCPDAPRVPSGVLEFNPANLLTSSNSILPPGPASGTSGRYAISIPTEKFQLSGEHRMQISQRSLICPSYRRVPMTNMILDMTAIIHWSVAMQRANPHSAWSKLNLPWSNIARESGSPTTVHSMSGKYMCGWGSVEKSSVHDSREEQFEPDQRRTTALAGRGCRCYVDIWELAAVELFWPFWMYSVAVGWENF